MSMEMTVFQNAQFGEIRTMDENGKVLFCGNDIAKALGYARPGKAIIDHCKGVLKRDTLTAGGKQEMSFITEGDVYRLISHSKLEDAQKFESWVFDDVLPSIRRNGGYIAGQDTLSEDELLSKALMVAQKKLDERNAQLKKAKEQIALMEPKAEYYDRVTESEGSMSFRETAKVFGIKEREFIGFLLTKKLVYRNSHGKLIPYMEKRQEKWFEVAEVSYQAGTETRTTVYTKITPVGRQKIAALLGNEGM